MKKQNDKTCSSGAGSTPSKGRRSALKGMVSGGAVLTSTAVLPHKWTRPIVESVILPAHAQTSPDPSDDTSGQFSLTHVSTRYDRNWLDWLVPKAYAVALCSVLNGCARLDDDGTITLYVVFSDSEVTDCLTASGKIGDTLTFGSSMLSCIPPDIELVGLTGTKPNRILLIAPDGVEGTLECQETSSSCSCEAISR